MCDPHGTPRLSVSGIQAAPDQKDQEAEQAYLGRGLAAGPVCSTAREGGACHDAHLVEGVAQVGLDGLLAQEQFRGDLRVGLAVGDEPRDLVVAFSQGLDVGCAGLARPGAPVDVMSEFRSSRSAWSRYRSESKESNAAAVSSSSNKVWAAGANKDQGRAQGDPPMSGRRVRRHGGLMARYLLHHRHEPDECGVAFTSFKGHDSPLRHRSALASCRTGGHEIWWTVEADGEDDALRLLPFYVAKRTTVTRVSEVQIP